jgi:cytochrome c oxidase subunit II
MAVTDTPAESTGTAENKIKWGEIIASWIVLTVVSVIGILLVIPHVMPRPAADTLHLAILTTLVFSLAAAPVGALIYAVALYALRHWRAGAGDEPPPDGPSQRGNAKVIGIWLGLSSLLCVFLLVWGLGALAADDSVSSKTQLTVDVTGQQWLWTFHYPGTSVTSNELYLPVDKTVTFDVSSVDVTHGFWIVQMGAKVDANPFQTTTVSVTPDKLGTFDIRCVELCGLNHAFMTAKVHVVSDSDFQSWLASQAQA